MSEKHLAVGSQDPPKIDGLLRLYSMLYCPFAKRARLVLKAKDIPHEIVNINLIRKPEWYFSIHPEGKVPALVDGSKVVVESLDICEYLDEKYPEKPMFPAEPEAKAQDKELIKKIGLVVKLFNECVIFKKSKSPEEWLNEFLEALQPFEETLEKRATKFISGDKPGMVDYMLWPWTELAEGVTITLGQKLPIQDNQIPLLRKWRKAMINDPVCSELHIPIEKFAKIIECKQKGIEPPYDEV